MYSYIWDSLYIIAEILLEVNRISERIEKKFFYKKVQVSTFLNLQPCTLLIPEEIIYIYTKLLN